MLESPGYWMYESSGVLVPTVKAYLNGDELNPAQIATMRAYLRQWISWPGWGGDHVLAKLRLDIDQLTSREAITAWCRLADNIGMDPL